METTNQDNNNALITLQRQSQLSYFVRSFSVYIDGNLVGRIKSGETKTYPVTEGEHTIQVKIDFYKSPVLTYQIASNSKLGLRCGGNYPAMFNFNEYLVIEPLSSYSVSKITKIQNEIIFFIILYFILWVFFL